MPIFKVVESGNINPPSFYNKMRNKAILDGTVKVQGDDAPPLGDENVLF